jgi:hypothetical protein
MIVKIFYEYLNPSTTKNVKDDLQKLEDKINMFAVQKGVIIHDIKYEKIQNQMQQMIIAFVHHTAVDEDTGEVKQDDIPKVVVEKK